MKNKKSKKKALKTKKTKINRRKRSRKTKKRSRKMRGKGSACSRVSCEPSSEEVNTYIDPREIEPWIKKRTLIMMFVHCVWNLYVVLVENMLYISCHVGISFMHTV